MGEKALHIAMYPLLALGHITPYLHLANKFAARGHRTSFLLPKNTIPKFRSHNHHTNLITLIPITVPPVDGLPPGTETTADIPMHLIPLLFSAMDLTQPIIEAHLSRLNPDFVFFDFPHWLPIVAAKLGVKSVLYGTVSPATFAFIEIEHEDGEVMTDMPASFPSSSVKLHAHEARQLAALDKIKTNGVSYRERQKRNFRACDAICFKTCMEMEGPFCDYLEKHFNKSVLLAGPVVPEKPSSALGEKIAKTLDKFEAGSVVYCALGSECILQKDQFQELLLGLELTGLPFLAALKPPQGAESLDSALPQGFKERMEGKGVVTDCWVQQQLILNHPSVGCFVTHCGSGSLSEAMVSTCQIVLLPHKGDQIINARLMGGDLKVGVEIEKGEEDGLFSRDSVFKAVKGVMDLDSEIGKQVRLNHGKWREFLLTNGLENSYIDGLLENLHAFLKG